MTANDHIPEAELPDAEFLDNRGAYWARLRGLGRVVKAPPDPNCPNGHYLVPQRDDVLSALHDLEAFVVRNPFNVSMADGQPIWKVPDSFAPPERTRFARTLHGLFTAKSVAPFEEAIRAHAAGLIAAVSPTGQCDTTHDGLVELFSHGALLTVCGIGHEHLPEMYALMRNPTVDDDGAVQHRLLQYLVAGLASGYRRQPGVLWDLIDAVDGGGSLTQAEFFGFILGLRAGSQTTINAIHFALLRLARDAQLRRRIYENPELAGLFVEEIVRIETATISVGRRTSREIAIGSVTIPAHTVVSLCLESASREDGGDAFSTGKRKRHWGFGGGMHRCIAAHLARLEMTIFVQEWLKQIPEFELQPGFQPAVYAGQEAPLTALPLRWAAS